LGSYTVLDHELTDEEWKEAIQDDTTGNKFNNVGDYINIEAEMAFVDADMVHDEAEMKFMDPYTSVDCVQVIQCNEMRYLPENDIRETPKAAEKIREDALVADDAEGKTDKDRDISTKTVGRKVKLEDLNVQKYKSQFLWQPDCIIRKTLKRPLRWHGCPYLIDSAVRSRP